MKVISVKKREYKEVEFGKEYYQRYDCLTWRCSGSLNMITSWMKIQELEEAYQRFINPPFRVECDPEGVVLTIKDKHPIYFNSHYPIALKEELEQALNSLMEAK